MKITYGFFTYEIISNNTSINENEIKVAIISMLITWRYVIRNVHSAARQAEQNYQISPFDFQSSFIHLKVLIWLKIFDSYLSFCLYSPCQKCLRFFYFKMYVHIRVHINYMNWFPSFKVSLKNRLRKSLSLLNGLIELKYVDWR
jgi:hypothetical protein